MKLDRVTHLTHKGVIRDSSDRLAKFYPIAYKVPIANPPPARDPNQLYLLREYPRDIPALCDPVCPYEWVAHCRVDALLNEIYMHWDYSASLINPHTEESTPLMVGSVSDSAMLAYGIVDIMRQAININTIR